MATVLVIGTFDSLHPGHADYFRQARELGDRVVALVSRDQTVMEVKGQLPRMNEEQRRMSVEAHPLIDAAYLGDSEDKLQVVCELKPDTILLGYDQYTFTDDLKERMQRRGLDCRIVRARPFHPETYKSSLLFTDTLVEPTERVTAMDADEDWLPL
jgi:FAD synthetase